MDSMYIMDPTIQVGKPKSFMDSARNAFSSAEKAASSAEKAASSAENSILSEFSTAPSIMQRVEEAPSNLLHTAEGMPWYKIGMYGVLLLILSVLGFNIFNYLGKVTQTLSDIFGPIIALFGGGATGVLKKTVSASAAGTGGIIKGGADVIDSGLGALENKLNESSVKNNIDNKKVNTKKAEEKKAKEEEENAPPPTTKGPIPDEAGSNTQSKPSKPSFCYIGEDRGTRSCIQVDKDSNCMSGEIFPSMELCINPALRS
jgi:hypothetical protein